MPDYRAESSAQPKVQAWVFSEDEAEAHLDPLLPRRNGWRISIEYVDPDMLPRPIRATWEPTLWEVLRHTDLYFPEVPVWKRVDTGQIVDLGGMAGHRWEKVDREFD